MATGRLKQGRHTEKKIEYTKDGRVAKVVVQPVEAGGTFDSDHDFSGDREKYELVSGTPGKGRAKPNVVSERGYDVTVMETAGPGRRRQPDRQNPTASTQVSDKDLPSQPVEALQAIAEDLGVDTAGLKDKKDVVAAIVKARAAARA